jgi:SnoaL-like domain
MNELERLLALEEIRALKARYCRAIDTKQWDLLRQLFSPDARFEGFGSAPDGADVDTFVAGVSARLRDAVSVHHCHMPEIVFLDDERARGVWAMQDHLEWPQPLALKEAPEACGFAGYGHYEEAYRCIDGRWYMQFLRLTRLRIDPLPPPASRVSRELRKASPDWLEAGA